MLTRAEQGIYDSMRQNIEAQPDMSAVKFMVPGLGEHMRLLDGTMGDGFHVVGQEFTIPGVGNERLLGKKDYLTSETWWHGPVTVSIPREVETEVVDQVTTRIPFTPFTRTRDVARTIISYEHDYAPATCVDVTTQKQEDAAKVLYRFDPYPPLFVHLPKDKTEEVPAYYYDFERFAIDIRLGMAATVPLRLAESFHDIALEKPAVVRQLARAVIQPVSDIVGRRVDDFRVYPNLPDEWPIHIGVPGEQRYTYDSNYVTIGKQVEA